MAAVENIKRHQIDCLVCLGGGGNPEKTPTTCTVKAA